MTAKKEQRIIDKPTKKEIELVLQKARAAQEKKKDPPAASPDKMNMLLEKIEGLIKRQDRIEQIYNKGLPTGSLSSEKKTTGQTQQSNEELLREAELEQEKAAGKEEPGQRLGQPQGQLSPEQYEKLPDSEKVKLLEQQVQLQQQQPNTGKGGLSGQAALYGLLEIAKTTSPVIIEAIKAKGVNNGDPLKAFFGQLGVYQKIESTIMDGFFNFMRNLSPTERQVRMDAIAKSPPGGSEVPKTDEGHIKP